MNREKLVNLGKEDDSEYMEADREFFRQNPDQDFYVRKRFRGEMIPGHPPNVIVRQLAPGLRNRLPCFQDPTTKHDLTEMTREFKYHQDLITLEQMVKHKGKAKKSKKVNKGFGKI